MSRSLVAGFVTKITAANVRPCLFASLAFSSGTIRVCSWNHNLAWDGYTWLGAGRVASIGTIEEGAAIVSRGIALGLSAIPAAMMAAAFDDSYQNRQAKLWIAALDEAHQVVDTPAGPFTFLMNTLDGEVGTVGQLQLQCEDRLANLGTPHIRRYTHEDQMIDRPDDRFFEYGAEMVEKELY